MKLFGRKMKKRLSALFAAVIAVGLVLSTLGPAATAEAQTYVALGDSISTGYGLSDTSDLYVNKLAGSLGYDVQNLAQNGLTTEGLSSQLDSLTNTQKSAIEGAAVMTVSIGGNDLLQPFVSVVEGKLGKDISGATAQEITAACMAIISDSSASAAVQNGLTAGITSFLTTFPKVISKLKTLNPNATIVVQTIYNPLYKVTGFEKYSDEADTAITAMNGLIKKEAESGYCKEADDYSAFKSCADSGVQVTNIGKFDVHPNAAGSNVIFTAIYYALKNAMPYTFTASLTGASASFETDPQTLMTHVTVSADNGYAVPAEITMTIGSASKTLWLAKGSADILPSDLTGAVSLTGSAYAESTTASPAQSSILVNGKTVKFEGYEIGGYNYFKLRDVAYAINGTGKQFGIVWDAENNAIDVKTGTAYVSVGGEFAISGDDSARNAELTTSVISIDGSQANLTAYMIGDNNYVRLRDIAKAIGFGVAWDAPTSTIGIDTTKGYSD